MTDISSMLGLRAQLAHHGNLLVGLTAMSWLVACGADNADKSSDAGERESAAQMQSGGRGGSSGEAGHKATDKDQSCSAASAGRGACDAAVSDAGAECGDGHKDPGEDCDDGNRDDGDDCPANCQVPRCRNGRVDPGEECDDGNQNDNDGCNNRCMIMKCGDGMQQDHEECDDGNQDDTDGCSNKCTKNECGNLRVDSGEQCDEVVNCESCKRPKDNKCRQCEEQHCKKGFPDESVDIDWVAGCLDNQPDKRYVTDGVTDDEYSKPCGAILTCARNNHCVTDPDRGAQNCVCGSASAGDCQEEDKANGPCKDLFLMAAFTKSWMDMIARDEDPSYPLGYASLLLKCDAQYCQADCAPWLNK